jgi:hypothetical protein
MSETISTTPVAELTDLEVLKEILHFRGPYGENVPWRTPTVTSLINSRSLELRSEVRTRNLKIPAQQSIGRRAGTALTPEELEIWHELVAEWDGVSPAPKGEDTRLDLQEG